MAARARDVERSEGARRAAGAGAVRRDGCGARRPGPAARDPAALRSDDEGNLVAAAALRATRRRAAGTPARTAALSRSLRLPAAACGSGRGPAGARRLVDALPGRVARRARSHAASG